jgi:hypothetical protein
MTKRWAALGLYVVALYAFLPLGPRLGLALAGTRAGAWLLGPGLGLLVVAGTLGLLLRLRRRAAPPAAYIALVLAGAAYVVAFSWLRMVRLERTHLPEYGIAAVLAWRAVAPLVPGAGRGYVAGAALGSAIGYGDELLQAVVPGRHYDLRDVAMNALGAVLGMVVLAAAQSGRSAVPAAGEGGVRVPDER